MSVENCKQCNRDMGYNSEEFELCAPCELGFTEKNNNGQCTDLEDSNGPGDQRGATDLPIVPTS